MKQRVTSLDLQALTAELVNEIQDYRLQNIYNVATSNRQYLLKFAIPDSKKNVVVDCGFKLHLTEFTRQTPQTPSNFVAKLRKHLKSKRLSTIKQVGTDRVVVLTFSDGLYHLVLEFFSAGNVILLDHERHILALQRLVEEKGNNDRYAVGEVYNLFDESLFEQDDRGSVGYTAQRYSAETVEKWISESQSSEKIQGGQKVLSIQKLLYQKVPHLSADLIALSLNLKDIHPSSSSLEFSSPEKLESIASLLNETETRLESILKSKPITGFIVTKKNQLYDESKDTDDLRYLYDQFHPFKPLLKDESYELIEILGYNKTLDQFFSTIDSSKYALRIQQQENQAKKRLEQARNDKHRQVQRLVDVQELNKLKGETIVHNHDLVEEAKSAVQSLIDQSMDWKTIEKLIKIQQDKKNKIALLINLPLNLKSNKISLKLQTENEYDDSDDSDSSSSSGDSDYDESIKPQKDSKKTLDVVIDLGLSAFANASTYFEVKKSTVEKQKKVEQSASKALKNIEQKIQKDLKKNLKQETEVLRKLRNPYFFEKYNWFISNENYLIISGKDDAQTDLIYHRYVKDDDIYVTSDVDGSGHVFIKNPNKGEVSPSTLNQAGILALATSKAWDNKMVTSPWWCYACDITKNDIDGGLLRAGTFRYLKDKNYLPPSQLVMGFGFIWKIKTEQNSKEIEDTQEDLQELENLDIDSSPKSEKVNRNEEVVVQESAIDNAKATENDRQSETEPPEDEEGELETSDARSTTDVSMTSKNKPIRGKKNKLKKIAQKYADQDEEERALRMEALGTLKQQAKREEELKKLELQKTFLRNKVEKRKRIEKITAEKYQNFEEHIDYENILNELTPSLSKDDDVLEAIPVFAPWSALSKFRYRVKIQPGSTKKGKAVQEIMSYFNKRPVDSTENDRNYDWPREHEIINAAKDLELLPSLYVTKVKVMLPGQSSASKKNSAKNNTKKGKKK